ncbi:MAG: hypothetical protein ACLUJR_11805 [Mediterraneibacter gnavus]
MDKLEVGDIFYIKVLDETLAYQIDQILTVLPEETDGLSIELRLAIMQHLLLVHHLQSIHIDF